MDNKDRLLLLIPVENYKLWASSATRPEMTGGVSFPLFLFLGGGVWWWWWLGMEWEDFINKQGNYIEWLINSSLTTDTKQKGPHAKSKEPYTLFFKDHLAKA